MFKGIKDAFRVKELRDKILFTIGMLLLYRFGAHLPVPGIPVQGMLEAYKNAGDQQNFMTVLNLFSGGALSRVDCVGQC